MTCKILIISSKMLKTYILKIDNLKITTLGDFPSSAVRICLPMQGHGLDPWCRRTAHTLGKRSPCATAAPMLWSPQAAPTEPVPSNCWSLHARESVLCKKGSCHSEKPVHHSRESPLTATNREKPMQQWKLLYPKINKQIK